MSLGTGHYTICPSSVKTVALQAPFTDGIVHVDEVVPERPCQGQSVR